MRGAGKVHRKYHGALFESPRGVEDGNLETAPPPCRDSRPLVPAGEGGGNLKGVHLKSGSNQGRNLAVIVPVSLNTGLSTTP